ncbi:MAG: hypothetical protein Q7J78_00300 [Clostridiales bacterium]|nr:hypothetical protein [Clostridiales bacterium]
MQIMLLRHPSKGTIGDQKGTFLDHRGLLPAEVCPLTLNANKKIRLGLKS